MERATADPEAGGHAVSETGELGEEVRDERVVRDGVVREVEAECLMTLETAKLVHRWLGEKIELLEGIL